MFFTTFTYKIKNLFFYPETILINLQNIELKDNNNLITL